MWTAGAFVKFLEPQTDGESIMLLHAKSCGGALTRIIFLYFLWQEVYVLITALKDTKMCK